MALRLELKQTRGKPEDIPARRWYFERGRRTLGRASDCNWHIPDPQRLVSKLHCTIEADREGFLLRDNSANGCKVDGRTVAEGDSTRLAQGSTIEIGPFAFTVALTGEQDLDLADPEDDLVLGDESLTISSILSDVAPKSVRSSGLYGGHEATTDAGGKSAERSSRNVEIGWSGPPETSGPKPILPMDWDSDSNLGNTIEHNSATRVAVPMLRATQPSDIVSEPEVHAEPATPVALSHDQDHAELEALVTRNERACAELFETLGLDAPPQNRILPLPLRLENLLALQQSLNAAVGPALDGLGRQLEPTGIEARVALHKTPFWRPDKAYWRSYRAQFEQNGQRRSLRELFQQALQRSLRGEAWPEDNQQLFAPTEVEPDE